MKSLIKEVVGNIFVQFLVVIIAFEIGFLYGPRFLSKTQSQDTPTVQFPTPSPILPTEEVSPTEYIPTPTIEITEPAEPTASASATIVPSQTPEPTQ